MKIRLIEPKPAGVNVFDRAKLPRLGLPLLGRVLADLGHDVRIYVETLSPVDWDDVASADLLGLSATTATLPPALEIARRARETGLPTVIGGSHVTFLPDEPLAHCDFVVRGEGQKTLPELVAALQRGTGYDGILGLSYHAADGSVIHNPPRPNCTQDEYEALPAPDLRLIVGHQQMTNVPIMTQWGCPYACDFCSVIRMFGRGVRARAVEDVLDELEQYRDFGAVFFYDDNFVVNKDRTKTLLRDMIARGLGVTWSAQMRADAAYKEIRSREPDHELLALMRDSGCDMVYCGFESVNPQTLKAYNKHQDVDDIRDSVRAFHEYGIRVHGMFALGADTDDKKTFDRTVEFALQNEIDTVQFLMITPLPGTPFWDRMEAEGRLLSRDWTLYDGHHCVTVPAQMSPYELQVGTIQAMSRFYSMGRGLRLLAGSALRNLGFWASLLWRERGLTVALPRIARMAIRRSQRREALKAIKRVVSAETWRRFEAMFMAPALCIYGRVHIRQWMGQAASRAHLEALRRLGAAKTQDAMPMT